MNFTYGPASIMFNCNLYSEGRLRTELYYKRDFNFPIVNFPFMCRNIPWAPAYSGCISQLIRYSRACSSYQDFLDRMLLLTRQLLNQGFFLVKLKSSFESCTVATMTWLTLRTICVTNDHGYVPLVVNTSRSFPCSSLITGFVTSSPPVFSGVRVTRSLVLYVCFVDRCLSFCTFSFGHCVVCSSSIYGFWLSLWYLQTLLQDISACLKRRYLLPVRKMQLVILGKAYIW